MREKTMRKWGAWAVSAIFVVLTAILGVAQNDKAEAKGAPAVSSAAASGDVGHLAIADQDVLDLQLD
jgi:hypothetical protein